MSKQFLRQSFLGSDSISTFANLKAATIGLGGGGSHISQQLAHVGVGTIVPADPDIVEDTNLNRLVGATWQDVEDETPKVDVAERVIMGVNPNARVIKIASKWQENSEKLRECHVMFGCVDSYRERDEIERFSRRFLIPYIDIGMDVNAIDHDFAIGGQVVLSSPGCLCLRCMGIITDQRLAEEADRYGDAGSRPQVVWSNGVLASIALGLFVQLVTPWPSKPIATAYLEYDGNAHTVGPSNRLRIIAGKTCPHYSADEVGDPFLAQV